MIRVLVCDDQPLVRTGLVTVLDAEPDLAVVAQAADGAQALHRARETHPDVVVTDVRMPGLDGISLTRALAGEDATAPLHVLVITSYALDEYVYEALRAGASGFLLKDALPEELAAAVRVVARGDALVDPAMTRRLIGRYAERVAPPGRTLREHRLGSLSARELEVLVLVGRGLSNREIAAELAISTETVKTHVSRILARTGLRDRVQAVALAFRTGLVS
jgi:DNA-binding NarL/FixJ family response regulator